MGMKGSGSTLLEGDLFPRGGDKILKLRVVRFMLVPVHSINRRIYLSSEVDCVQGEQIAWSTLNSILKTKIIDAHSRTAAISTASSKPPT